MKEILLPLKWKGIFSKSLPSERKNSCNSCVSSVWKILILLSSSCLFSKRTHQQTQCKQNELKFLKPWFHDPNEKVFLSTLFKQNLQCEGFLEIHFWDSVFTPFTCIPIFSRLVTCVLFKISKEALRCLFWCCVNIIVTVFVFEEGILLLSRRERGFVCLGPKNSHRLYIETLLSDATEQLYHDSRELFIQIRLIIKSQKHHWQNNQV